MISASEIIIDLDSQKYYPPQAAHISIINDTQMEQEVEPITIESSESEQLNPNTYNQQSEYIEENLQEKNNANQMEVESEPPIANSNTILEENPLIYLTGAFSFGQPLDNSLKLSLQEETAKNLEVINHIPESNEILLEEQQNEELKKKDEGSKKEQFLIFLNEGKEGTDHKNNDGERPGLTRNEPIFEAECEKNEDEVLFHPDIPFAQLRNNYSNNPFIQELISNIPQNNIPSPYAENYAYVQETQKNLESQAQYNTLRQELMSNNFENEGTNQINYLPVNQESYLEVPNGNEEEEQRESEGKEVINEEIIQNIQKDGNVQEPKIVHDFEEIERPENLEESRIKQFFGEANNEQNLEENKNELNFEEKEIPENLEESRIKQSFGEAKNEQNLEENKNEQNFEAFPEPFQESKADQNYVLNQNVETSKGETANEDGNQDFLKARGFNESIVVKKENEKIVETSENKFEVEIEETKTEKLNESNFQDKIIEAIANDQGKIENPEGVNISQLDLPALDVPLLPFPSDKNKPLIPNEADQPQKIVEESDILNVQSNINEKPVLPERIIEEQIPSNINEEAPPLQSSAEQKEDDQIENIPDKISENAQELNIISPKENQLNFDSSIVEPISSNFNVPVEMMDIEEKRDSDLPPLNTDEEVNKEEFVASSKKIKKLEGKKLIIKKKRLRQLKEILKYELEEKMDALIQKNLKQYFNNYQQIVGSQEIIQTQNLADFKTTLTSDLLTNFKNELDKDLPSLRQEVSDVKKILNEETKIRFDQEFPAIKEDLTLLKKNQDNIYNEFPELKKTLMEINKETLNDNIMLTEMNKLVPQIKQDLLEMRDFNKVSTNFLANEFNKEIPVIKQDLANVKHYMTQDLMNSLSSEINKELPTIKMNLGDLRIYQKESATMIKAISLDIPHIKQDISELKKTLDKETIATIVTNTANIHNSLNSNFSEIKQEVSSIKQTLHTIFREIICVKEDVHLENKNSSNFKNFNRSSFQLLQQYAIYIKTYEFPSDRGSLGMGILVEWVEEEKNIKILMTNKQILKKNMNIDLILKEKPANSELRGKCKVKGFLHQKSELAFIEVTSRASNGLCSINFKDVIEPEMGKKKKKILIFFFINQFLSLFLHTCLKFDSHIYLS